MFVCLFGFFISYYTQVQGRAQLFYLDSSIFTLDPYFIILSVKQGDTKKHFFIL